MTPILFLDFDGPLFPERHIPHSRHIDEYPGIFKLHPWITYWEMDVTSVRQLNALYNIHQFDVVVSSSWRDFVDRHQTAELFEANGLLITLHEDWRTAPLYDEHKMLNRRMGNRAKEISDWLDKHTTEEGRPAHIILDDPWSGATLEDADRRELQLHNLVMVDPNVGISPQEYKHMHNITTSWAEDPESRVFKQRG